MNFQAEKDGLHDDHRAASATAIQSHHGFKPFMLTDIARDLLDRVNNPKDLGRQFSQTVKRGECPVKEVPIPQGAKHNNHYRKLYPLEGSCRALLRFVVQ